MKSPMKMLSLLILCVISALSFSNDPGPKSVSSTNMKLAFITYNAYGNNLFIDNLTVGKKFGTDIAIMSINNIPKDTSYNSDSSSTFTVAPRVSIVNVGALPASNFHVIININGFYYQDQLVSSLGVGSELELTYPQTTLPVSTPLNMVTFTSLASDTNRYNDTLYQNSIVYRGVKRKILLEEFTSYTCNSCGINNPALDAYINSKIDTITAIKYHTGFPLPGNDSLYIADSSQVNERLDYYDVTAVPNVIVDGVDLINQPYSGTNLDQPIADRRNSGSPVIITVNDTRIGTDSISCTVTLNIISPIKYANYKMRVNAIERKKSYSSAPGTNGETVFYDIFRHAYPNVTGISIPTAPGIYPYNFRYKREASWVDSMLYTAVYIQNDQTREVLNTSKSRNITLAMPPVNISILEAPFRNVCISEDHHNSGSRKVTFNNESINSYLNYELFENDFPPQGWILDNPNSDITFAPFHGVNGIAYGGNNSIYMNFYNYNTIGRRDTLITRAFNGIDHLDSVSFDYAYAQYSNENDSLIVLASTNDGITWPIRLFAKGGTSLATTSSTSSDFIPVSSSQWRTYTISLQGIVGIGNISTEIPSGYELKQNFPNPFNPTTNISFAIPKASDVIIKIYDMAGKKVDEISKNNLQPGTYNYQWSGAALSSGIYYYSIEAGDFRNTKKMVLIK